MLFLSKLSKQCLDTLLDTLLDILCLKTKPGLSKQCVHTFSLETKKGFSKHELILFLNQTSVDTFLETSRNHFLLPLFPKQTSVDTLRFHSCRIKQVLTLFSQQSLSTTESLHNIVDTFPALVLVDAPIDKDESLSIHNDESLSIHKDESQRIMGIISC